MYTYKYVFDNDETDKDNTTNIQDEQATCEHCVKYSWGGKILKRFFVALLLENGIEMALERDKWAPWLSRLQL